MLCLFIPPQRNSFFCEFKTQGMQTAILKQLEYQSDFHFIWELESKYFESLNP